MSRIACVIAAAILALALAGCTSAPVSSSMAGNSASLEASLQSAKIEAARAKLQLTEDYRDSFVHGDKPAEFQKYIVLHDTEGDGEAENIINYWDGNGLGVASHFVVNKDGSVVQCVPLDKIAHHAGYGDTGNNERFGIAEDGRDDMEGSTPLGDWVDDYGMNAWSIGIELIHVSDGGDYPEEQLQGLDALIAYIDAYYGFESAIIEHEDWRAGNSDMSPEFDSYLVNYQSHRTHV